MTPLGICPRKKEHADIRKDRLEGRDHLEDLFDGCRKNMIQSSGNRKERRDARGRAGIDFVGTDKRLNGEWKVGRRGMEVEISKMIQTLCFHDCEDNGIIYRAYLVWESGIVVNLSLDIIIRKIT